MGSDSSKHASSRENNQSGTSSEKTAKGSNGRRQSLAQRRQSVSNGRTTQTPIIRVGTSVSYNDGFFSAEESPKPGDGSPVTGGCQRSGSVSTERSNSIRNKHPVPLRYRQLIQSCFQNPHEVVGRKILKRTAETRPDFGKFYMALTPEQREEVEESIKVLLKKTVCNIDFLDEIKRLAEGFGERFVQFRSIGFKADFFSNIADATIKECTFLDNAIHPAHQTLGAFSQFITMVFSSVRDGFYNEMRRLRRTSNSFSTGSNGSCRRKKTSIDSIMELTLPSRSASPSSESRLSDECFTPTIQECEEGFLKPPAMVSARIS